MVRWRERGRSGSANLRQGSLTLRLRGGVEALPQVVDMLALLGMDCEVLEDSRPQSMPERTEPDFDSFVCFDLETSGTYGAAGGDAPAEITEIGAVRVVNGEITETFSQLVNPGRKVVPRIARIPHITDGMAADQPGPEEAIRRFARTLKEAGAAGRRCEYGSAPGGGNGTPFRFAASAFCPGDHTFGKPHKFPVLLL
nr:3'-5' exonuclease [uncultured Oscillibacter sp.]